MDNDELPLCPRCGAVLTQHRNVRRVELVCECGYIWRYTAQPVVEPIADSVSWNGNDVPPFLVKRFVLADPS